MYFKESDACSSEEASQASQSQPMKAVKERRKPKKYVTYPLVVEDDNVNFIEGHLGLYNHKLHEFRNADLKNLAW